MTFASALRLENLLILTLRFARVQKGFRFIIICIFDATSEILSGFFYLVNAVIQCDVAVQWQVEVTGPNAAALV